MPGGSFAGPYSGNDSESIEWALVGKDLTISCWVKIPNDVPFINTGTLCVFATMADLGNHNSAKSGLSISATQQTAGGNLRDAVFKMTILPSGNYSTVSVGNTDKWTIPTWKYPNNSSTPNNDWHLVTATYKFNASDNTDFKIYFDNAQTLGSQASSSPSAAILTSGWPSGAGAIPGRRSGIGGSLTTSGGTNSLQQRELVIWDRLLTSAERTAIYNSGVPLGDPSNYPSGAVAGWMFENNIEVDRTFYNSQQQYTGRVTLKNAFDNSKYAFVSNYDVFNRIPSSYNSVQTNHISIPQVTNNPGLSSGMDTTNLVPSNLIKSIPYSGYSMYFDGAVDSIDVPDSSTLKPSTITISIWFKSEGTQGAYTYLISKYYSGSGPAYSLYTGAGTTNLSFSIRKGDDSGWSVTSLAASGNVMDGLWHNVIATFDGTIQKLYIDGILKTTATPGTTGITYGSGDLTIGAFLNTGTLDFNGYLSNTAIWDRAITEDEILRVYNGGIPGDLTDLGPASWWSLGADSYYNGSNWICPDIGANTNNGTSDGLGADGLVGIGPDSLANGTSTNLDLATDLIGEAPGSTGNAISINMNSLARTGSTP